MGAAGAAPYLSAGGNRTHCPDDHAGSYMRGTCRGSTERGSATGVVIESLEGLTAFQAASLPSDWEPEPADRMAAAALGGRVFEVPVKVDGRKPGAPPTPKRIGIVMPQQDAEAEALVLAFGRSLRRDSSLTLVVLGDCIDAQQLQATGNIELSGVIATDAYLDRTQHHRVDALLSPFRTSAFGFFDELSRQTGLPRPTSIGRRALSRPMQRISRWITRWMSTRRAARYRCGLPVFDRLREE